MSCLGIRLVEKGRRKHSILHTDPHQFGRITIDLSKVDAMLTDPGLEFLMRCYLRLMPFLDETLAESNIGLHIAARANGEACNSKGLLRLEVQH